MSFTAYESLIGVTLDQVRVDWRNGMARVSFLPATGSHVAHSLRINGLTRIVVARSAKASHVVKSATRSGASDGGVLVSVEMESGETIVVEASEIVLE